MDHLKKSYEKQEGNNGERNLNEHDKITEDKSKKDPKRELYINNHKREVEIENSNSVYDETIHSNCKKKENSFEKKEEILVQKREHQSNKIEESTNVKYAEQTDKENEKEESTKKSEMIFKRKIKRNAQKIKERENEILVAYWIRKIIEMLNEGIRNGEIKGSYFIARKIAEILKKIVEIAQWNSVHDLIELIKYVGKDIIKNNKMLFVIPNVIKRVLTIVRTEHFKQLYLYKNTYSDTIFQNNETNDLSITQRKNKETQSTTPNEPLSNHITNDHTSKNHINNMLLYERKLESFDSSFDSYFENHSTENTYKIPATNTLKHSIIEGIVELMAELDISWEESEQRASYDLFMENDVILTLGYSAGVEKFLKTINKKKEGISVIVVGGDTKRSGFKMAKSLSDDGVDTTYITDAAVFAVITKVTKVVLGSYAVTSSGGAITKVGGYNIAYSAQFHCKPVTIVLPLLKLIHVPIFDPLKQNELQPGPSLIYNDMENLFVRIPKYDYIPEHLITLYITEAGPMDSFQLYNIAKKKYNWEDLDLNFE